MARDIVVWPNKVLSTPTRPVTDFGPALQELLEAMHESMVEARGVGIAANQIGVALRCAWVAPEEGKAFEIINPEVLERSEPLLLEEGCLSVPDEWERTPRFKRVKVRYQDRAGGWHELEAEGRVAHVLQHEIDHLDGHVFVDHLSSLKRSLILERMKKLQRALKRQKDHKNG